MLPPVRQRQGVGAEVRRLTGPMDAEVALPADTLLRCYTEALRHGAVGADDPVLAVHDGDQIGNAVEGQFPLLLGLQQLFLGLDQVIDIQRSAEPTDDLANCSRVSGGPEP